LFSLSLSELVVSAIKECKDRDAIIVRVHNPSGKTINGQLQFVRKITEAYQTNLTEERKKKLKPENNVVKLELGNHKIETFEFKLI
jgi:alpha-mannosidase